MLQRKRDWVFSALLGLGIAGLSACTWVELKPEAEAVQVVSDAYIDGCVLKGTIQSQTTANVGFVTRSAEALQLELSNLARNQAVVMGANRLVPDSLISPEGSQRFRAYLCP